MNQDSCFFFLGHVLGHVSAVVQGTTSLGNKLTFQGELKSKKKQRNYATLLYSVACALSV